MVIDRDLLTFLSTVLPNGESCQCNLKHSFDSRPSGFLLVSQTRTHNNAIVPR